MSGIKAQPIFCQFTYSIISVNVEIATSSDVIKPNMATSMASKLDEMHNGKYKLKPKNLDK